MHRTWAVFWSVSSVRWTRFLSGENVPLGQRCAISEVLSAQRQAGPRRLHTTGVLPLGVQRVFHMWLSVDP